MRKQQKGFSLIELLIVVAIILIIAAIAIPSLLRSRMAANHSAAVGTVRSLNTAEVTYSSQWAASGYADTLVKLGPGTGNTTCPPTGATAAASCLVDSVLGAAATVTKGAYQYNINTTGAVGTPPVVPDFTIGAVALSPSNGTWAYCSTTDLVVRQADNAAGTLTLPVNQAPCLTTPFAPLPN